MKIINSIKKWWHKIAWKYKYGANAHNFPISKYGLFGEKITKKKIEEDRKLDAAFDIMCGGILYKPKGCKLTENYKSGCGMCGKGHLEVCQWK